MERWLGLRMRRNPLLLESDIFGIKATWNLAAFGTGFSASFTPEEGLMVARVNKASQALCTHLEAHSRLQHRRQQEVEQRQLEQEEVDIDALVNNTYGTDPMEPVQYQETVMRSTLAPMELEVQHLEAELPLLHSGAKTQSPIEPLQTRTQDREGWKGQGFGNFSPVAEGMDEDDSQLSYPHYYDQRQQHHQHVRCHAGGE